MLPTSIVSLSQINEVTQTDILNNFSIDGKIRVLIDNYLLETDQDPILVNSRILVPLRAIFEGLGAQIEWDDTTQTAKGKKQDTEVVVRIGDVRAEVNGQERVLDVPATIVNNRTLVPMQIISESLGVKVDWDGNKNVVLIQTK